MTTGERTVVLITGASSGLGRATASFLAARGYRVFGTSREIRANEAGVEMLALDVRNDRSVEECVSEVIRRAGCIDVLINNAGVMHLGIAEETSIEDARAVFETNFFGVVRVTNAVLPAMRARRRGRILNVSSLATWVGEPGESFYGASKRALMGYSEALRHEVWPLGLHVSVVEPGAFRTQVLVAASTNQNTIADYDGVREPARRTIEQSLKRGADPERAALAMMRILRARAPRLRYGIGLEARWVPLLRGLLPQRVFDALVRRGFGLPRPRKRLESANPSRS